MALVERPQPAPEPDVPVGDVRRPHWIAWLFVLAGMAMQLFILYFIRDIRHQPPDCGESCAYAGMGLLAVVSGGAMIWLPGIAASVWLFVVHWRRRQVRGGQRDPLVVAGASLALTVLVFSQFLLVDHKIVNAKPTLQEPVLTPEAMRKNDEVAGYSWAADTGLRDEGACAKGSAGFQAGCLRFVRAFNDTTADGRAKQATIRPAP